MKKLIYVFLILMLSVNYLYAQGVDSKGKKPSKNSEAYLISETTKVIDEYLSIDNKFEPNSDCDSTRFKECYYCSDAGGTVYYSKYVYNSKTFQEVYAENFVDGEINTIILRKRSDGLIEAVTSEVVG